MQKRSSRVKDIERRCSPANVKLYVVILVDEFIGIFGNAE